MSLSKVSRQAHLCSNNNSSSSLSNSSECPSTKPTSPLLPKTHPSHLPERALSPADLAYQESLIQERETEIREIETGIHELNEIFRDLGTLVVEQGSMLGASCTSCHRLVLCIDETWYTIL